MDRIVYSRSTSNGMNISKPKLIIFAVIAVIVLVFVLMMACVIPGMQRCTSPGLQLEGALNFWGIGDSQNTYEPIIINFKKFYPKVEITYRGFNTQAEYDRALLESMAQGKGPDVFMVLNSAVPNNTAKIFPMPQTLIPLAQLQSLFPKIVEQDFFPQQTIYGLPLSIDTLALIYNRNFIDQAAIQIPKTWEDFQGVVKKLTVVDPSRKIVRAGAAIGGSQKNISAAPDILSLLMLQTGTKMISNDFKSATFASPEGRDALRFYTQFSNGINSAYTWNETMPNDLDAFGQESVAMIFNYASSLPEIQKRNPFIDYKVAPVPQPASAENRSIAYPKYWGYTVSRQSSAPDVAWQFVLFMTTNEASVRSYLTKTKKPPALDSLIRSEYINNPELGVFARQALIARSWPQINNIAIGNIFSNMIELVTTNQNTIESAIGKAQEEVSRLMSQRAF